MFSKTRYMAIAIALILFGHTSASSAACLGHAKGEALLISDCDVGINVNMSQQEAQLAGVAGGEDQSLLVANRSGSLYPANNGNGRYICTPSGFGHIATCSLRFAN